MPIGLESGRTQPIDGPFGQKPVLETPSAQDNPPDACLAGNIDDHLDKCIMELLRDEGHRNTLPDIREDIPDHR